MVTSKERTLADAERSSAFWKAELIAANVEIAQLRATAKVQTERAELAEQRLSAAHEEIGRLRAPETTSEPDGNALCVCGHRYDSHSCQVGGCDCGYFEAESGSKTSVQSRTTCNHPPDARGLTSCLLCGTWLSMIDSAPDVKAGQ